MNSPSPSPGEASQEVGNSESLVDRVDGRSRKQTRDSPIRPPRTHSKSSQLSSSSHLGSDHKSSKSPSSRHERLRPSRSPSTSSSPPSVRKSRHKSKKERFLEDAKSEDDDESRILRPFNRKSSAETAIHVSVTQPDVVEKETNLVPPTDSLKVQPGQQSTKIMVLVFALYLIFGGLLFKFLSFVSCPSQLDLNNMTFHYNQSQKRDDERLVGSLWNLTLALNVLHDEEWKSSGIASMTIYREQLLKEAKNFESRKPDVRSLPFSTSILYSYALVSMTGYPEECLNSFVVQTTSWQVFTIVYSVIGVPLFWIIILRSTTFLKSNWDSFNEVFMLPQTTTVFGCRPKKVLMFCLLLIYFPIIGHVIYSFTGSRKSFLDLFLSLTFIGPVNCSNTGSDEPHLFDDVFIIIKVIYLFFGHNILIVVVRDCISKSNIATSLFRNLKQVDRKTDTNRSPGRRRSQIRQMFSLLLESPTPT